jgi:hypothetical protein
MPLIFNELWKSGSGEMAMADNRETVEMRLHELQSEIAACEEKREKTRFEIANGATGGRLNTD